MNPAEILKKISDKKDLTSEEAESFLDAVMKSEVSPILVASILVALKTKGESAGEIVGFLRAMRRNMVKVNTQGAMDIVGTGGDATHSTRSGQGGTFNISTTVAFVVAGAGVKVAKHGNRAASSKCGSADVLEALGVNIQLSKEQAEEVFQTVGFVFLMAPLYHPSMKEVGAVRRELKIRTIFNILGPFANPASTARQLTGVPSATIARTVAAAAKKLGYKRMLIVSSDDGMDEIGLSAKTRLYDVRGTSVKRSVIDPKKYGYKKVAHSELIGGDSSENAQILRDILGGKHGPRRDIVVFNSAFALLAGGAVKTVQEGIQKAQDSIDKGRAQGILDALVRETQKYVVQ